MADDYIYDVGQVARDSDRSLICRCPHCQEIIGIEGDDIADAQGEQFKCRCGGWFQIDYDAVRVKAENLAPNKGVPDVPQEPS
ncbi:hypothetical protein [Pseudomonas kuykendallii]|uniref:hypothetical protein n=1 Tax=Pseudomonas kuykendallii TaxID=1007099 RepID=UPI0028D5AC7F|nr:hypothetical protein [Pseudomonas kuykendallii]